MSSCLLALLALVATGRAQQPLAEAEVTYAKHVAPIIQRSCESCHRQGGFAPLSLMTYDEVIEMVQPGLERVFEFCAERGFTFMGCPPQPQ